MKEKSLQTVVEPEIDKLVKKLASIKGVTVSEYIRTLIISDLDSKKIFTKLVKQELDMKEGVRNNG